MPAVRSPDEPAGGPPLGERPPRRRTRPWVRGRRYTPSHSLNARRSQPPPPPSPPPPTPPLPPPRGPRGRPAARRTPAAATNASVGEGPPLPPIPFPQCPPFAAPTSPRAGGRSANAAAATNASVGEGP